MGKGLIVVVVSILDRVKKHIYVFVKQGIYKKIHDEKSIDETNMLIIPR